MSKELSTDCPALSHRNSLSKRPKMGSVFSTRVPACRRGERKQQDQRGPREHRKYAKARYQQRNYVKRREHHAHPKGEQKEQKGQEHRRYPKAQEKEREPEPIEQGSEDLEFHTARDYSIDSSQYYPQNRELKQMAREASDMAREAQDIANKCRRLAKRNIERSTGV